MGMLDGILGQVANSVGGFSGQQQGLAGSLLNMLANNSQGGLGGLVQKFEASGLGPMIQQWISTGPNPPITPNQVQQVLGQDQIQQLAQQHGIDANQVTSQLAQILPALVDHMTPNGTLPQGGGMLGALEGMLGGLKLPGQ